MSYEGYVQLICESGHYTVTDCNDYDREALNCGFCNTKVAWENHVDLTNGSWDENNERIDGYFHVEVDVKAETCECPKCGNNHSTSVSTYKIPEGVGNDLRSGG